MLFEFLGLGFLAGILSGLFGIGGGIVMVPMLIAVFGLGLLDANATSLAAMLLPVGIFGVINYYKAGLINVRNSLWISLGLLGGSFVGAELAVNVNISLLSKLYAALLIYVATGYFDFPSYFTANKQKDLPNRHQYQDSVWKFIILGLSAGVIAGLFGKGGGIVIVPALVKIFKYDTKAASATSLAALQLPVGLPSVIVYAQNGHLEIAHAALIAFGMLFGAFFGSKLALNLPSRYFKQAYGLFLIGVAIYMIIKHL